MKVAIAALALITAFAAQAQEAKLIQGGPVVGMYSGSVVEKNGPYEMHSVRPSAPDASPLPTELRAPTTALLAAYRNGNYSELDGFLANAAVTQFCPTTDKVICEADRPFDGFGIEGGLQANTPYFLPNKSVRIEWMAGKEVRFLSFLTFSEGKLVRVKTNPALIPVLNNG